LLHLLNRRSVGPPMDTTSDARHSTRCCGRLRRKRSASNFFRGFLARELRVDQGQICGVSAQGEGDAKLNVEAKLVVGADGRNSRVAELTGLPGKEPPNGRIFYFAHYRNLPLVSGTRSQLWFLEPDVAYTHSAALARTGMAAKSGDFSTGRPFNFLERLTFSAAARDPVCADTNAAFGSRCIGVSRFLRPDALARAMWVNARHVLGVKHKQLSPRY